MRKQEAAEVDLFQQKLLLHVVQLHVHQSFVDLFMDIMCNLLFLFSFSFVLLVAGSRNEILSAMVCIRIFNQKNSHSIIFLYFSNPPLENLAQIFQILEFVIIFHHSQPTNQPTNQPFIYSFIHTFVRSNLQFLVD
jgi:hypothetical protein